MPWNASSPVDQRVQFIAAVSGDNDEPFSAVCRRFGISRKTGYKWVERYNLGGPEQLHDRVSAPRRHPKATPVDVVARVLELRKAHPRWGPRKLREVLATQWPDTHWPAPSTLGELLKRHGQIVPRRRRVRWVVPASDRPAPAGPNDTWCVDFKGDFKLGDGTRCYALTVTDLYSRQLLAVTGLRSTLGEPVIAEFERLFALYGLPARIRSDNGVPFATTAVGGLSPLSIWWARLGIVHERIAPGHPEQNGAHERMHRTLKAEATKPAEATLAAQQVRFDRFRAEYNEVRPHEALGQKPPSTRYRASDRVLPALVGDPSYPEGYRCLRVVGFGHIKLRGQGVQIHAMLRGQLIGLRALDDVRWEVFFARVRLGVIDTSATRIRLQPAA